MVISMCSQCRLDTGGNHEWNCAFNRNNSVPIPKEDKTLQSTIKIVIEKISKMIIKKEDMTFELNERCKKCGQFRWYNNNDKCGCDIKNQVLVEVIELLEKGGKAQLKDKGEKGSNASGCEHEFKFSHQATEARGVQAIYQTVIYVICPKCGLVKTQL